jgi:RNA polymerase sigma factor (sigma-70 family)
VTVVGRPLDEAELVERAKRGDASAYRALMEMHEQIAFRTAYAVTGNAADAEEVAQDAFVKAHRALVRFRRGSAFRPWLLRIVGNEARNRVRAGAGGLASPNARRPIRSSRAARPRRPRRRSWRRSGAVSSSQRSSASRQTSGSRSSADSSSV